MSRLYRWNVAVVDEPEGSIHSHIIMSEYQKYGFNPTLFGVDLTNRDEILNTIEFISKQADLNGLAYYNVLSLCWGTNVYDQAVENRINRYHGTIATAAANIGDVYDNFYPAFSRWTTSFACTDFLERNYTKEQFALFARSTDYLLEMSSRQITQDYGRPDLIGNSFIVPYGVNNFFRSFETVNKVIDNRSFKVMKHGSIWNFGPNHVFSVGKNQIFAYQLGNDANFAITSDAPTLELEDGCLSGYLEADTVVELRESMSGATRSFTFKVADSGEQHAPVYKINSKKS